MKRENNTACLLRYASTKTVFNHLIIRLLTLKNSVTKRNKAFVTNYKSISYKSAIVTKFVTLS